MNKPRLERCKVTVTNETEWFCAYGILSHYHFNIEKDNIAFNYIICVDSPERILIVARIFKRNIPNAVLEYFPVQSKSKKSER